MKAHSTGHPSSSSATRSLKQLPNGIWVLGLGSMFMDISSELIHSLLPVFMVTLLGASMITVGLVEGVAEATASMTKVLSGVLSDRLGRRKLPLVAGYAMSALTKPIFPLAASIGGVFAARFIDRVGKGIRVAPRDALVADIAPPHLRGAAYGLRQALDSIGALIGPLLAVLLMASFADDIRAVMWVAVAPALATVLLLLLFVREPGRSREGSRTGTPLALADAARLPWRYWLVVVLGAVFSLARFSEAFLILRAQDVGVPLGYVPVVMIVMNLFYSSFAYPAGAAADRVGRRALLLVGLALLIAADLVLAAATSPWLAFAGAGLWGLHMASSQGLLAKLVSDGAPPELRGTAFGIFNLVNGAALLLASIIAGAAWSALGASTTFLLGAAFALVGAIGVLAYSARSR